MSRGGFRGGSTRGFARGGSFRGRGGAPYRDAGPPDTVLEMGTFVHAVEDEMLCASAMADRVPYFNAPIYLQNKSVIGKVDEILGPINEVYFSVKMSEGMLASSFKAGDKVYIGGDKLLPMERFLPKPKGTGAATRSRGGERGRGRGAGTRGVRGSLRARGMGTRGFLVRGSGRGGRGTFSARGSTSRGRGARA